MENNNQQQKQLTPEQAYEIKQMMFEGFKYRYHELITYLNQHIVLLPSNDPKQQELVEALKVFNANARMFLDTGFNWAEKIFANMPIYASQVNETVIDNPEIIRKESLN